MPRGGELDSSLGDGAGILVGSLIGTRIVAMLSTVFLAVFFTCFLFYTGTQMLLNFKPKASRTCPALPACLRRAWSLAFCRRWSALVAAFLGAVSVMVQRTGAPPSARRRHSDFRLRCSPPSAT